MFRFLFPLMGALTACVPDETVFAQTNPSDIWTLTLMEGTPITTPITLEFPQKGRIAGRAPCNRYFATQDAPLPWFNAGAIGATRMACPELSLETAYFNALSRATLVEIQGDTLILSTADAPILTFTRAR